MALSWGASAVTRQHQRAMRPLAAAIGEAAAGDVSLLEGGGAGEEAFMEAALRRQRRAAAVVDAETGGYLGRYQSVSGLHIAQDLTGTAMEAREVKMLTLSGPVTRRVAIRKPGAVGRPPPTRRRSAMPTRPPPRASRRTCLGRSGSVRS